MPETSDPMTDADLDAYLARIGYAGDRRPTAETLEGLHLAHATSIPFENLDIALGRPIRIDPASVRAKLVGGRRGGYCFEQNLLLGDVLERLGFAVTRLAARVRWLADRVLPRTHMMLRVEAGGRAWLADVGFGGWGLLHPIPWEPGRSHPQFAWAYRLDREGDELVLRAQTGATWTDLYGFTLEPQLPADYEIANYFVSTHPSSRFVQTLTAQRPTPEARYSLRNREFTIIRPEGMETRAIADEDELLRLLAEHFGLAFPPGTRFRMPGQGGG